MKGSGQLILKPKLSRVLSNRQFAICDGFARIHFQMLEWNTTSHPFLIIGIGRQLIATAGCLRNTTLLLFSPLPFRRRLGLKLPPLPLHLFGTLPAIALYSLLLLANFTLPSVHHIFGKKV